jgi:DNA-binding beta-propeller fold protein YncE
LKSYSLHPSRRRLSRVIHQRLGVLMATLGLFVLVILTTTPGARPAATASSPPSPAVPPTALVFGQAPHYRRFVYPITLSDNTVGTGTLVRTKALAISPDAEEAWISNGDGVVPLYLPSDHLGKAISTTGSDLFALAPDGKTAYEMTEDIDGRPVILIPVDLSTGTVEASIPIGNDPLAIAVTPNGRTAYVAEEGSGVDDVVPVDLTNDTLGSPIVVSQTPLEPVAMVTTPDGQTLYVAAGTSTAPGSGSITPINTTTNTAGTPIAMSNPRALAMGPDGRTLYVLNMSSSGGFLVPIATGTGKVGKAIPVGNVQVAAIAITPDGQTAYLTRYCIGCGDVLPVDLATGKVGPPLSVGSEAYLVAITPDQGPIAAFSDTPGDVNQPTTFDASASEAPGAPIATYQWVFGDGTHTTTDKPTTRHIFTKAGTYTVTLTETDADGTSTTEVFTGQMASRNGGPQASVSHAVTISRE